MSGLTTLRITEKGYEPADDAAVKQHKKLKVGMRIGAKINTSRSHAAHAHYWLVVNTAAEGMGYDPAALHEALKVACNVVDTVKLLDGKLIRIPGSMSYDAMNAEQFKAYAKEAYRVLEEKLEMSIEEMLEKAA